METNPIPFSAIGEADSDPTYEAWKRVDKRWQKKAYTYSDPTYEAWKLQQNKLC